MSVIVAKKVRDGYIVAGDSQATAGDEKNTVNKLFKAYKDDDVIIGVVGTLRDANIMMTVSGLLDPNAIRRDELDLLSIILYTVPAIKKAIKENEHAIIENGMLEWDSQIILLYKDKCFEIDSDFSVMEIDEFGAIGSPSKYAKGAYEMVKKYRSMIKKSDREIVKDIVKMTIDKTAYVGYPIKVLDNTKDKEFEVIYGRYEEIRDIREKSQKDE